MKAISSAPPSAWITDSAESTFHIVDWYSWSLTTLEDKQKIMTTKNIVIHSCPQADVGFNKKAMLNLNPDAIIQIQGETVQSSQQYSV